MAQAAGPLQNILSPAPASAPSGAAAPNAAVARTGEAFQRFCAKCEKVNADAKLCSSCHGVRFCDQACLKAVWAAHKALCKTPSQQDLSGLPPLHRAILAEKKKFFEPGFLAKHQNVRDSFNGTIEDLENLMVPLPPDDETDTGWEFRDDDQAIKPLTRRQYFAFTKTHYLDGFHGQSAIISHLHETPCDESHQEISPADPRVQAFDPKKAPKTYMQRVENMGFGVFAKEVIEEGSIVCFGAGKLVEGLLNTPKANRYNIVPTVDSTEIAGKGTMINDGTPNCRIYIIHKYKGMPQVPVIVALRKILPGEELRINYSTEEGREGEDFDGKPHPVKVGAYGMTADSIRELSQFCKGEYQQVIESENQRLQGKKLEKPITQQQKALLYYLLDTPYAFIKMHLMKSAPIEVTKAYLPALLPFIRKSSTMNYSKILGAIEKIHNKGDETLVEEVLKLGDSSPSLLYAMLLEKMERDPNLTSAGMKHYHTLCRMLEDLTTFSDPAAKDLFKPSEEKKEEELDKKALTAQFQDLPPFLKNEFLRHLRYYVLNSSQSKYLEPIEKELKLIK